MPLNIGQALLGSPPPINPFDPNYAPSGGSTAGSQSPPIPAPGAPSAGAPPAAAGTPQVEERKKGWKGFIERFKADPDLRAAMMQTAIGFSQPAPNWQAGIGQGVNAGMKMTQALKAQHKEEARQAAADSRSEREVGVHERNATTQENETQNKRDELAQRSTQFDANMEQNRKELDARLEQIRGTAAYQQGLLEIDRKKAGEGGEAGAVNSRWSRLRDAMLQDPTPDLQSITDPAQRKARAEVKAFDLINRSGQDQAKFISNYIATQQLFLPDPEKDPKGYAAGMQRVIAQATAIAGDSGFQNRAATPAGPPAPAGTPAPAPTKTPSFTTAGGIEPTKPPTAGEVRGGYRFKGGDASDKNNWEKVQ